MLNFTLRAGDPANNIDPTVLSIGGFLNAILQFLIVAVALYFIIVLPMNKLASMRKKGEEAEPAAPAEDVLVLQEIRDLLAAQNAHRAGPAAARSTGPSAAERRSDPEGRSDLGRRSAEPRSLRVVTDCWS
ncbi:MscL family protein [Oerskovia sp. M15]